MLSRHVTDTVQE